MTPSSSVGSPRSSDKRLKKSYSTCGEPTTERCGPAVPRTEAPKSFTSLGIDGSERRGEEFSAEFLQQASLCYYVLAALLCATLVAACFFFELPSQ